MKICFIIYSWLYFATASRHQLPKLTLERHRLCSQEGGSAGHPGILQEAWAVPVSTHCLGQSGTGSGHGSRCITTIQKIVTGEGENSETCPFKATSDHPSPPTPPRAGQTSEWSEGTNKDFLWPFLQHFRSISSNLSAELHSSCFPLPFFSSCVL